ncbi:MAG TPA: hypothetical protein DHV59_07160 [Oxalobacteraceae bacterium]|nr:hypothetical protein [Oxalobacteraceae bacterium]
MRYDHRIQEWFKQTGRRRQKLAGCEKNAVAHYVSLRQTSQIFLVNIRHMQSKYLVRIEG